MSDLNSTRRNPSSNFFRLPPEILLRILECSPPSSLKQLRASCSTFKALADPLLWDTVNLYPHMDRFRQILNLSMHPPVRCHVRRLVYNLQWAPVLDHIIRRIKSVYSARASASDKASALKRATDFKKGTMEPGRDDDIELLFLQDILRNLKSLESIIILENNAAASTGDGLELDLIPSFYQKLREKTCGALPDTDLDSGEYRFHGSTRSTKRILVAAHSLEDRIKHLEIRNAHWEHVTAFEPDGKHIGMLAQFISGLKFLSLHGCFAGDLAPSFLMCNLGLVLNLASNLEGLDLSFGVTKENDPFLDDDWSSDDGDWNPSQFKTQSILELFDTGIKQACQTSRWGSGLKRLAFSKIRCRRSELSQLLQRCAPTLKELELNHLELISEKECESKPCIVIFLEDIKSILRLEMIWLSQWFRNSGHQEWYLDPHAIHGAPPGASPLLLEQVFQWILGTERCPIEQLAIPEGATDVTDAQLESSRQLVDNSFVILTNWFPEDDAISIASGVSAEYALTSVGIDVSSPMPSDPPPGRPPYSPLFGPEPNYDWTPSSPIYQPDPTENWLA